MSRRRNGVVDTIRAFNDDGSLYVLIGGITAVLSWFVMPLLGLIAGYFGLRLYIDKQRKLSGGAIAFVGMSAVLTWFVILATF